MEGGCSKPDSNILGKKLCGRRLDDRISELPDEIIVAILSFLPLKKAVATSVLSFRWLNMWKHIPTLKFDRISQLPDQIVVAILSFLSLREAATTSVLSSRWLNLWKHTPSLDFNDYECFRGVRNDDIPEGYWDVESCRYVRLVNSVLQVHKASSLKEFRISFYVNESAHLEITKWLDYVFSRQVETLELDFIGDEEEYMVVLEEVLRESRMCQTHVVQSLKTLYLSSLKVSGEAIELLLSSCPFLEKLVIQEALLTSDVVIRGTTLVLKHLDMYHCSGQISIEVSAPKLTWLRISATSEKNLLLLNLPKLSRADYTCRIPSPDYAKHFASAVFSCISRLKFLYLRLGYPKEFLANGFIIPRMPKLKKLVVRYYGVQKHGLLPVTAFIWASPRLEQFKIEFVNVPVPQDVTTWMEVTRNVERCPHQRLKVFKFEGFSKDAVNHIELVKYVLSNCAALEKISISCMTDYEVTNLTDSQRKARVKATRKLLQGIVPHHIKLRVTFINYYW